MYTLTLTQSERQAIDWIGDRYPHGNDLRKLLSDLSVQVECDGADGGFDSWGDPVDMTFHIPEHVAWAIRDSLQVEDMVLHCFAESLGLKIEEFCDAIV